MLILIAAQNNSIIANYIKVKIDNASKNSKGRLYGTKDKTSNHIVSVYS